MRLRSDEEKISRGRPGAAVHHRLRQDDARRHRSRRRRRPRRRRGRHRGHVRFARLFRHFVVDGDQIGLGDDVFVFIASVTRESPLRPTPRQEHGEQKSEHEERGDAGDDGDEGGDGLSRLALVALGDCDRRADDEGVEERDDLIDQSGRRSSPATTTRDLVAAGKPLSLRRPGTSRPASQNASPVMVHRRLAELGHLFDDFGRQSMERVKTQQERGAAPSTRSTQNVRSVSRNGHPGQDETAEALRPRRTDRGRLGEPRVVRRIASSRVAVPVGR